MTALGDAQAFIDRSRGVRSEAELANLLEDITRDMGFDYFALIHHVDIRSQTKASAIWIENYPDSWAEVFVAQELYATDPILVASQKTNVGFAWSDVPKMIKLSAHHKRVLQAVRSESLGDGFTVPAHVPGEANGSCNFAMAGTALIPRESLPVAHLVGSFAFQAARTLALQKAKVASEVDNAPRLTTRQLDCVLHMARGTTDWEIGQILGISATTVRDHIKDACERFGVRKRMQLGFHVVHAGHLTLSDVLR